MSQQKPCSTQSRCPTGPNIAVRGCTPLSRAGSKGGIRNTPSKTVCSSQFSSLLHESTLHHGVMLLLSLTEPRVSMQASQLSPVDALAATLIVKMRERFGVRLLG